LDDALADPQLVSRQLSQGFVPKQQLPPEFAAMGQNPLVEMLLQGTPTPNDRAMKNAGYGGEDIAIAHELARQKQSTEQPRWLKEMELAPLMPVLDAGKYLGGVMAGNETLNTHDVLSNLGGLTAAAAPVPGAPAARTAEKIAEPLFSAVGRALEKAPMSRAAPEQWMGWLRNQPGVKADELSWLARNGPLPGGTREEMQQWAQRNGLQLNEKVLDTSPEFDNSPVNSTNTRYGAYQLPGGENYREMLLTKPSETGAAEYKSSHWDDPNVLAHVRMNDRTINTPGFAVKNNTSGNTGPVFGTREEAEAYQKQLPASVQGSSSIVDQDKPHKTLFLEELQSDWHQKGRRSGYQGQEPRLSPEELSESQVLNRRLMNGEQLNTVDRARLDELSDRHRRSLSDVPDAPLKQTWPDMLLKRMIREGADSGYDALAWTPGQVQADRYDLIKQLNSVSLRSWGDTYKFKAFDKNNNIVVNKNLKSLNELPDYIGKEVAQKLVDKAGPNFNYRDGEVNLDTQDLKIGGEGMKGFYDKMLVDKANALAKKYGGKVEQVPMQGGTGQAHFLRITPELRKQAMEQGFPLFSLGAAAAGGATMQPQETDAQRYSRELMGGQL
jgi:hypothetical protein